VVFTAKHLTDTDKQNRKIHKSNTTRKANTQNTAKLNYTGSVASYNTRPGNAAGLLLRTEPTQISNTQQH